MVNDIYISENKTNTFAKGYKVVMHGCGEANFPQNKGKVWSCLTNSFKTGSNSNVVFLEGYRVENHD